MSLATDLVAAGLTVRTVAGWGTRGGSWSVGKPVGVMQHHTAPPVPFPINRLYGDLLKCNINVKPDGTVWLIAARACNFSSGSGSSIVLDEVRRAHPPTQNAWERHLSDDTNGNPWFFNFENDHPGDGSPLPPHPARRNRWSHARRPGLLRPVAGERHQPRGMDRTET